jgi:multisubunit Na+/H+ antiporter MnhB subunit
MALLLVVGWSLLGLILITRRWAASKHTEPVRVRSIALALVPWIAVDLVSTFALHHFTGLSPLGVWRLAPDLGLTAVLVFLSGAAGSVIKRLSARVPPEGVI